MHEGIIPKDFQELYSKEEKILGILKLLKCDVKNSWLSRGLSSMVHVSKIDWKNKYNEMVREYRLFIELKEINHEPIFKYCKKIDGEVPEFCDNFEEL